jgi:hypothetical protein
LGDLCDPRGRKSGSGMDNLPIPRRELSKMITSAPITIRVRSRTSRKIVREFIISDGLVFQSDGKGIRFVNVVDNFLRALISTQ